MNAVALFRSRCGLPFLATCALLFCATAYAMMVDISGTPSAPAQVSLGTSYDIAASAAPDTYCGISFVEIYSNSGDADGPIGDFIFKAQYQGSQAVGSNCYHTFTVVNQATGWYWWQSQATEYQPGGYRHSAKSYYNIGPYYTP